MIFILLLKLVTMASGNMFVVVSVLIGLFDSSNAHLHLAISEE